jgi:cobalt/nickel transport system permease protein
MGGIHALIGIGEGLITTGALAFLYAARKDLLEAGSAVEVSSKGVLAVGGLITLILAVLSPLASSHPDGLEWVAQRQGFLNQARSPFYHLIPDYVMPGIADQRAATVAAAVLGSLIVFTVAYGIARGQKQRNASEKR